MQLTTILEDLYRYNDWANGRILALCIPLTDAQLDQPREMGFGSLRNTVFHILAAEEIWFERWNGDPWRAFQFDAEGLPMVDISARLHRVAERRKSLLDHERQSNWSRIVNYQDARRESFSAALADLALHVANHGVHHRAQALSFLRGHCQTVSGGLDYVFYRLARPFVRQESATAESLRLCGLEIETGSGDAVAWDPEIIRKYFSYGDWANHRMLNLTSPLDDSALDRAWNIGMDTIRKTALHIADAERWWIRNWTVGPSAFEKTPETTSVSRIQADWERVIDERNQFVSSLDAESAHRVVTILPGGPPVSIPVVESLVQLCGHGTHHRAQMINMLRHSGVSVPPVDLGVWVRESSGRVA